MRSADLQRSYFRQSGWMIVATTASGLFMFAVHFAAPWMPKAEYGLFGALLAILNLMMIPALGLQTVFAQQSAAAIDQPGRQALSGAFRALLRGTFFLWVFMSIFVWVGRKHWMSLFHISNPMALWVTVLLGWPQLWLPIIMGVLQGQQNFLWLGWANIANGLGRFLAIIVIVIALEGQAAGAMTGALLGLVASSIVGFWHTRETWQRTTAAFSWQPWLRMVLPLTLGLGAGQFMLAVDMIVVRGLFDQSQTGPYAGAGMIGRGLVVFAAPLTAVMFPKIVRGIARAETTSVLPLALAATAVLTGLAAFGCTLIAMMLPSLAAWFCSPASPMTPEFKIKILQQADTIIVLSRLIPWFVWCMLPLALANVVIANLLAREQYRAIPWLLVVAAGYLAALSVFNHTFEAVVRTLGVFALCLLGVASWFTGSGNWGKSSA